MSMCGNCGEHRSRCICKIVYGSAHVARLEKRIIVLEQERAELEQAVENEVARLRDVERKSYAALWWLQSVVRRTGITAHAEGLDYGEVETAMHVAENVALGRALPGFEWGPTLEDFDRARQRAHDHETKGYGWKVP